MIPVGGATRRCRASSAPARRSRDPHRRACSRPPTRWPAASSTRSCHAPSCGRAPTTRRGTRGPSCGRGTRRQGAGVVGARPAVARGPRPRGRPRRPCVCRRPRRRAPCPSIWPALVAPDHTAIRPQRDEADDGRRLVTTTPRPPRERRSRRPAPSSAWSTRVDPLARRAERAIPVVHSTSAFREDGVGSRANAPILADASCVTVTTSSRVRSGGTRGTRCSSRATCGRRASTGSVRSSGPAWTRSCAARCHHRGAGRWLGQRGHPGRGSRRSTSGTGRSSPRRRGGRARRLRRTGLRAPAALRGVDHHRRSARRGLALTFFPGRTRPATRPATRRRTVGEHHDLGSGTGSASLPTQRSRSTGSVQGWRSPEALALSDRSRRTSARTRVAGRVRQAATAGAVEDAERALRRRAPDGRATQRHDHQLGHAGVVRAEARRRQRRAGRRSPTSSSRTGGVFTRQPRSPEDRAIVRKFTKPVEVDLDAPTLNGFPFHDGVTGRPILDQAVAYVDCEVRQTGRGRRPHPLRRRGRRLRLPGRRGHAGAAHGGHPHELRRLMTHREV